jgi:hypothetical protein
VTLPEPWRELHRSRFNELPLDCGDSDSPGVIYNPELRDWSDKATTTDQARMERYIDRYDLRGARILHIGIGNSGLAKRFYTRVREIVGTTIDEPEMEVARALPLPNYSFVMHNKYSGRNGVVDGKFDFILDNNLTSPCCCIRHLAVLFEFYAEKLAGGGQVVTDRQGLEWVPPASQLRWGFDLGDLRAVSAVAGFSVFPMTNSVYVLAYSAPPDPGLRSRVANRLRRAAKLPGRIVKNGPRTLACYARNWARRIGAKR